MDKQLFLLSALAHLVAGKLATKKLGMYAGLTVTPSLDPASMATSYEAKKALNALFLLAAANNPLIAFSMNICLIATIDRSNATFTESPET